VLAALPGCICDTCCRLQTGVFSHYAQDSMHIVTGNHQGHEHDSQHTHLQVFPPGVGQQPRDGGGGADGGRQARRGRSAASVQCAHFTLMLATSSPVSVAVSARWLCWASWHSAQARPHLQNPGTISAIRYLDFKDYIAALLHAQVIFALLLQAQQLKQAVYDPMTSWHAEYDRIKVRRSKHPKAGSGSGFAVSGCGLA